SRSLLSLVPAARPARTNTLSLHDALPISACAWRLTSPPSTTRPQSGYGQVASPRATVPGDCSLVLWTISNEQTRPSPPGPPARCGTTRTPVPLEFRRQLGESGIRPAQ